MTPQYEARIAPFINVPFTITQQFGEEYGHRALDIATATALGNVPVYSVCKGTIILNVELHSSYGNYIIIKGDDGMGYLYAHLDKPSPVTVGERVDIGSFVGNEGSTGESTGIHLHFEMQDISTHDWVYRAPWSYYTNPADFMGIPNVKNIWAIYDGTPIPPTPGEKIKRKKFPWVLYARKLRNKKVDFFNKTL